MNSITINGAAMRNGVPVSKMQELMKGALNFGDAIQKARDTSKTDASQSRNYDTYEPESTTRTKLSDQDLADLASKYDPSNMTQDQYDSFLEDLMEKGALSRFDAMRLGYHGWRVLDMEQGLSGGWASATSLDDGDALKESLESKFNNLKGWLESMLVKQDQGTGTATSESLRKKEALDALYDIVKRM